MRPHSPQDVAEEGAPSSLSVPLSDEEIGFGDSLREVGAAVGWTFSWRVYKSSSGRSNTADELVGLQERNAMRWCTYCTKAFV